MYSVDQLHKLIEDEIAARSKAMMQNSPVELYQPIQYSLEMGGKRLRPVLVLLAYNLFAEDVETALSAAVAIEVFHNFTLLHDDIMDKADVRRNRPTVHIQFDENSAILSGDAMAFQSYKYLLECRSPRIVDVASLFTKTAVEVCEGQQFDMDFESRLDVQAEEYIEMIRLKTAVLLAASLKTGALLANADEESSKALYDFGIQLGLAFQLQDDLLDTFGDQNTFGKKIGGDILANKKTYLLIKALKHADGDTKNELLDWIGKSEFNPDEKIAAVTRIYEKVGVKQMAQEKVDIYFNNALKILQNLDVNAAQKETLLELAGKMLIRKH